ncbi:MAG: heparinase II/III family protein [Cyclobacteriaceae bacterium]
MLKETEHPRLFINNHRIEELKEAKNNDSFFQELLESLIGRADALLGEEPIEFKIVGPRMLKNCQEIHSRVTTLALSYLLTDEEKYAARAVQELTFAANFPHWNKDHFLDTAELVTAFAIGYDWLYHTLSDEEKSVIKNAMVEKGLKVGVELHAQNIWWAGHKFNWNQVCNGGLIIGALSIADENPALARQVFDATVKYLPIAFNSYGRDGGWEGGPDYWAYTTWYSVLLVDALLGNTEDDFGLSKTPGFDKTGLFPIYNAGNSGRQFNFADGDPDDTHKTYPALFWLGRYFGLAASINENNRLLQISMDQDETFDAFNLVWYTSQITDAEPLAVNRVFKGIDAGYLREAWDGQSLSVSFKGGFNLADHAHLDLGTFVLDCFGERWVSDLGRDEYDLPEYFDRTVGGGRWQYFRLNTKSHNTLLLNGENQKEDAKAKIQEFDLESETPFVEIDLSDAYEAHAKSAERTFQLSGENQLTVSDRIVAKDSLKSIQWQVLTSAEVLADGKKAILFSNGKKMQATIEQPSKATFELQSAQPGEPDMKNEGYGLLVFRITEIADPSIEIKVKFES